MLKKTVTYTDYDDNKCTEELYFNLSKLKLGELEKNGTVEKWSKLSKTTNGFDLLNGCRDIILFSYGEKSEDGKRFIQSEELSKAFSETACFEALFDELINDENSVIDFVRGIFPSEFHAEFDKQLALVKSNK